MAPTNLKSSIAAAIKHFSLSLSSEGFKQLLETLGYSTQREVELDTHTPDEVVEVFGWGSFREDKGLLREWESVDCLFQVGEEEISQNPMVLFKPSFDTDYLKSYGFIGITLKNAAYSRSQLASITREINRQSDIPIMVLFRYGSYITLALINRRPNKLDRDRDVLEKITLIKDIQVNSPHRAHIEILQDLALASLKDVHNFDELHTAWQKALDTSKLNEKFFREVSNWYFWALQTVKFPDGAEKEENIRNATSIIRLITRLIFVWFLKEKGLVPGELFKQERVKGLLQSLESEENTYYKAILQNLFFATLNTEMNTPKKPDNRKFRGKTTQKGGRDQHYGIANVYRYENYFKDTDEFLRLCSNIPFLNGGLFECLDKAREKIRIDGFSDREDNPLSVPNVLFFGEEKDLDLNTIYGTKNKKYKVQGLIEIFNRYKFTIDENTPIEEEIALDPELLGKVFENLLAEYNPETETTARKQTGSFYTPREIVNYMVDEALIAYLVEQASSLYNSSNKVKVEQASSLYNSSNKVKVEQASSLSNQSSDKQDAGATATDLVEQASSLSNQSSDKQDACPTATASSLSNQSSDKQDACPTATASSLSNQSSDKQDACPTATASSLSNQSTDKQDAGATATASSLSNQSSDKQDACPTATDIFFSEDVEIDITQRNLPHWRQKGVTYFVTFRLANSISQDKLNLLKQEREDWLKKYKKPLSKAQTEEYYRLFSQRVEDWLDAGIGECYLKDVKTAQIVADALRYFDGDRYHLGEWVIMPNHVHVLVTPLGEHKLSDILHSWKSFTANQINKALNRRGKVWQEEYYDRIIRGPQHLYLVEQYIHNNPQKAGISLVEQASSLSNQSTDKQDACATAVEQASSLYNSSNKQDACATINTQDGCVTLENKLRHLLSYNNKDHQFNNKEVEKLIQAIDHVKIIDIACGSGAFPMGILQKLVFILGKLDPSNSQWKEKQKEKAIQPVLKDIQIAKQISYEEAREEAIEKLEERLTEIEQGFANNEMDYPRKLFLIENCIFGVDIQPIAVQIAKLRFFISLIVDQKINDNQPNRGILPLPNLETKFVAANSLIGVETQLTLRSPEVIAKEQELKKIRQLHFSARTPATKRKYRERDEALRQEISKLLKSTGLETATADTLARWNPYDLNGSSDFFDAEWMFGVVDGFDICIGNPPYVRQEKIKELKPILKQQYNCFTGVADLYVYFFERGVKLLRDKGILCYISSNKYFRSGYGKNLREFLAKQTQLQQLIDFGDAPVFTAIAYPSIIITMVMVMVMVEQASSLLKPAPNKEDTCATKYIVEQASSLLKSAPNKEDACATKHLHDRRNTIRVLNWEMGEPIDNFIEIFNQKSFTLEQKALKPDGWQLEDNTVLRLLEKLRKTGTPLGEYVNGRFYYGIKTGFNEAFIVDRETRDRLVLEHPSSGEILKPFLRGKDVKRWVVNFAEQYLIKIESSENKHHPWTDKSDKEAENQFALTYPAIYKHLNQFREQLIKRYDQGKYFWELRSCKYWDEFEENKIVYPDIYEHQSFAIDQINFYYGNTCYFIPTEKRFLCALLNSSLIEWFYSHISNSVRGGYLRAFSDYIKQIPIPSPTDTQDACVTEIVNKILEIKRQNPNADTSSLEKEIDQIVYQLYGLTDEEIGIIENRNLKSSPS